MEGAIPRRNKVVLLWEGPLRDVGHVERALRVVLGGKLDHPWCDVEPFNPVTLLQQSSNETALAAASHVQCCPGRLCELQRPFELRQTILGYLRLPPPPVGNAIILFSCLPWSHRVASVKIPKAA